MDIKLIAQAVIKNCRQSDAEALLELPEATANRLKIDTETLANIPGYEGLEERWKGKGVPTELVYVFDKEELQEAAEIQFRGNTHGGK